MTYQVDRPPEGTYRTLEVSTARHDTVLRTTGVVVSGTSEGRTEARLRRLIGDSSQTGELPVDVSIASPYPRDGQMLMADVTVTANFAPIASLFVEGGERTLRFSIAVQGRDSGPFFHHELETAIGSLGGMHFEIPIEWTVAPKALAVVVEDLNSGTWGGSKADL